MKEYLKQPAVTVGVKPLVWFEVERGQNGYGKWTAEGYTVRKIEGMFLLDFAGDGKSFWRFPDAAKAAAQRDYETRILAALEPVAAPDLTNPVAVHANMLRGTIAKPTVEQIIHLYGVDALTKALAPVIVREAGIEPVAAPDEAAKNRHAYKVGFAVGKASAAPAPAMRLETVSENIARDMREGRFPARSEPQMVPVAAPNLKRIGTGLYETQSDYRLAPHLQSIVEAAKTAPQWDTVNDRMAPQPAPDPASTMRCAECDCQNGGGDCTWIKAAPDPAAIREAWEKAYWRMRSYAVHDNDCKLNKPPRFDGPCSCGLTAALEEALALIQKGPSR